MEVAKCAYRAMLCVENECLLAKKIFEIAGAELREARLKARIAVPENE